MTRLPAWTRDPATLELIIHEATRRGDVESINSALRLMVACDPRRAEEILIIIKVALAVATPEVLIMGWSIGYDYRWNRDVGYGVPATCDQPGCGARIDRGLAYVCGSKPYGGDEGCGLYFCETHLNSPGEYDVQLCDRCERGVHVPHTPTPDVPEWTEHKATDPSWAAWRAAQEPAGGTDHP